MKKWYATFCFLFIFIFVMANFSKAGCNFVSGEQEIKIDMNPDVPGLEIVTSAFEVVEAIVLECPEIELKWFFYTVKIPNMALGNSKISGKINYVGIIKKIPTGGIGKSNLIPKIISHCPETIEQMPILDFGGTLESYAIWADYNSKIYISSNAYIECEDTIVVNSPVATTIEVPVKVNGSIVSALSFGVPPDTSGNGKLKLTGQIAGHVLDVSGEANAVGTIPSVDNGSIANVGKEIKIKIPVNEGITEFTYKFKAEGSSLSTAKGLSRLGVVVAAANTGVLFPDTFSIGNFQGEMGQALPTGIEIKSKETGQSYCKIQEGGSSSVKVPDLTGFMYSGRNNSLETVLKIIGLTLGSVAEEDSSLSQGTVIGQSLTAGVGVQIGTTIDITVSKGQLIDVPNLTNFTLGEAETHLKNLNLTPDALYTSTNNYTANKIITQQPSAGSKINTGSVVSFWIAKKIYTDVSVPNVSGLTKEEAVIVLEQAGLLLDEEKVFTEPSNIIDKGKIIRSTTEQGTIVIEGTKIGIVISTGSGFQEEFVIVPNVKYLNQEEAENQIVIAGLGVGNISLRYSDTVDETKVIWQSISPGEKAEKDSIIDLIVSKGNIDLSNVEIGYADVVIDAYYSGANPIHSDFYGNVDHQSPLVVLGNNNDYLSLPTGSYVIVGFTNNTVIDAPDQDDIFIKEEGNANDRADIYVSSNGIDFTYLSIAGDNGVSSFDLSKIGYTDPVTAIKIVGLDNNGETPGFDLVSVRAIDGAVGPPVLDCKIEISSSMPAYAFSISGTLAEQIYQLNAGPPPFNISTWKTVHRHNDFHSPASFICGESSQNLDKPYLSANDLIQNADEVTFNNCSSAFYRFTFELPSGFLSPCLEGIANVDDQGIVFLNGHQISMTMTEHDFGKDSVDPYNRSVLSWPTQDTFKTCNPSYFVPGTNELVFGIAGDASAYEPTGLEFKAVVNSGGCKNINLNKNINLKDAILALQICANLNPYSAVSSIKDINGDSKIGLEESVFILQTVSNIRSEYIEIDLAMHFNENYNLFDTAAKTGYGDYFDTDHITIQALSEGFPLIPFYVRSKNHTGPHVLSSTLEGTESFYIPIGYSKIKNIYILGVGTFLSTNFGHKFLYCDNIEHFSFTMQYNDNTNEEIFPTNVKSGLQEWSDILRYSVAVGQFISPEQTCYKSYFVYVIPVNDGKTLSAITMNDKSNKGDYTILAVTLER